MFPFFLVVSLEMRMWSPALFKEHRRKWQGNFWSIICEGVLYALRLDIPTHSHAQTIISYWHIGCAATHPLKMWKTDDDERNPTKKKPYQITQLFDKEGLYVVLKIIWMSCLCPIKYPQMNGTYLSTEKKMCLHIGVYLVSVYLRSPIFINWAEVWCRNKPMKMAQHLNIFDETTSHVLQTVLKS